MSEYTLREATLDDMQLLFDWRNEPEARVQSFCSDAISLAEHQKWFSEKMKSDLTQIWILTDCGQPIGQIRCDCNDKDEGVISYSIDPAFRRQGNGKRIVRLAHEKIRARFPQVTQLVAFVKPENLASRRIFVANGYKDESTRFVFLFPRPL